MFDKTFRSVACMFLCLAATVAFAQSQSGQIQGRVVDPQGAVVSGASVQIVDQQTGVVRNATTNKAGLYTVPFLDPARYKIFVQTPGFSMAASDILTLTVGQTLVFDVALKVGGASQTVTVNAGNTQVDTTDASVSTVINRQFISNIPLNGRTLQNLINLTPGVVVTGSTYQNDGQFSVNGQRADTNYYTIDGVSANVDVETTQLLREAGGAVPGFSANGTTSNLVSVDAIQEFRIQTSTFAPEFGRTPGAQVAITTRSGTNQFHGTLFEYFRNSVLDASNWFNGFLGLSKGVERQNDFGGVIGGPIYRNKAFFFFSYEGQRLEQPSPMESLTPDANSRTLMPAEIQPLLNAFPLPNVPETPAQIVSGIAQFNATAGSQSTLNATSLRLDDTLTKTWSVFARYVYAPSTLVNQPGDGATLNNTSITDLQTQTATAGMTKTFGTNIANETLFNWTHYLDYHAFNLTNFGGATVPTKDELYPPSEGVSSLLPPGNNPPFEFYLLGVAEFHTGLDSNNLGRQINLVDNFSYQVGTHQLKFGLDWRRLTPLARSAPYAQIPLFCGVLTCPDGPLPTPLSGSTYETIIDVAYQNVGLIFNNYSFYAQDTWQATPRTNLTYGLRYDINPAPTGQNVQLHGFVDPFDLTNLTLSPAGTPLYPTKYGDIAPRIGLAYRVRDTPSRETIFRAGFGVFYDLGNNIAAGVATNWPYLAAVTTFGDPFPFSPAVATPPPFTLNPPYGEVTTIDPKIQIPRTYQWNIALQQGVGTNQTVSLTYISAAGRDLQREVVLYPASVPAGETIETSGGTSNYNALQVQYQRSLYKQLQALVSYTWSHSIDTQSTNSGSNLTPSSQFAVNEFRASSDFDVRHALSAAMTYQPLGGNYGTLGNLLTHGWALDAIYVAQTAKPVDLSAVTVLSASGADVETRPNFVPGVPYFLRGPTTKYPGGRALNRAAFTYPPKYPATGYLGDVPRNYFRGFNLSQLDVALHRQFPLYRNLGLQFRAEVFNVLNEPNFAGYTGSLSSQFFGQSQSTLNNSLSAENSPGLSSIFQIGGPRSIQLALKLIF
jgi:Carboxypeptidase regulatory-like domain/TonB-dependent Receptor Plug Domain/TonB dependent receptor